MRPPASFDLLLCAAIALALAPVCAKNAQGFWTKPPSASDSESQPCEVNDRVPIPAPDLKAMREHLALLETRLSQGASPSWEPLAEAARLAFILGEVEDRGEREKYYEKGKCYSEVLIRRGPARVEGHYWLALNTAGLAEVGGARRALGLVPGIIRELETAVSIDETYDRAGPHRVLGRIYCKAPCWPLSEGDIEKSLRHLRMAVKLAPENSTNHLYLAETLVQLGQSEEARRELEIVMQPTCRAVFPHNLEEDHDDAILLLKRCR